MRFGRISSFTAAVVFCTAALWFVRQAVLSPEEIRAQQTAQQSTAQPTSPQTSPAPVVKSESRVVRVDVVVTDKKGNYITDLTEKDFKVYEDNKQQEINNFSFGSDPTAPNAAGRHYLILFFDDSTMDFGDQPRAREAAAKFI